MNKYRGMKFRLTCISLVIALFLSITLVFFNMESSAAAQNMTSSIPVKNTNNNNNLIAFNDTLILTHKDGTILPPEDCHYNRLGDCYDYKRGIAYVWIQNGTATLPQYFGGNRNYSLREGIAVLPLDNSTTFGK
jgi:hypothetical protein